MTNYAEIIYRFRWQLALLFIGALLAAGGVFLALNKNEADFEIVESEVANTTKSDSGLVVEVSGAVNKPGVYEAPQNARIEDVINLAGGFSPEADTAWIDRYLNRASFATDGQKIYIPSQSEVLSDNNVVVDQSGSEVLSSGGSHTVNINTATQSELEELHGIGPVYARKIIDNRPYSNVEELLMKKVISQKIYDDNKDLITVY